MYSGMLRNMLLSDIYIDYYNTTSGNYMIIDDADHSGGLHFSVCLLLTLEEICSLASG